MKKSVVLFSFLSIITICFSGFVGLGAGYFGYKIASIGSNGVSDLLKQDVQVTNEQSAVIAVAEEATPSVVSIVITKDVPIYEQYRYNPFGDEFDFSIPGRRQIGTEEQQVGAGTGFIVSAEGLIITNKHVVSDEDASYTAIFNDGSTQDATVLARDTLLDIAFLDIEGEDYTPLKIGTSSELKVGQSVIAIGNALGEFSNTVSTGIVSGLSRDIVAGDQQGNMTEQLDDVIQTDASINLGNSGGPLLDIQGNVIGVNVAVAGDAENIGFAIPIDVVKELLDRLQNDGNIDRPVLGVRYVLIDEIVQEKNNLSVDYGALVSRSAQDEPAVIPGSAADKAGIIENDIILEVDGEQVNEDNTLANLIQVHNVGDEVTLKVLRKGNEIEISVTLDQTM